MFAEVFNSTIKSIHLALEVKTSFDSPTPMMVPAWNLALRSLDFPLTVVISIIGRERRRNLHTKKLQSKD
jgi:hypothetical protein